jgi:hypothetical protein
MPLTVRVPIETRDCHPTPTVLLVSADAEWRSTAERTLVTAGYRVIAVRHPDQALVESTRSRAVDLVLAEGEFGRGGLPHRIFEEHPLARTLHFATRPHTPEELLKSVHGALK